MHACNVASTAPCHPGPLAAAPCVKVLAQLRHQVCVEVGHSHTVHRLWQLQILVLRVGPCCRRCCRGRRCRRLGRRCRPACPTGPCCCKHSKNWTVCTWPWRCVLPLLGPAAASRGCKLQGRLHGLAGPEQQGCGEDHNLTRASRADCACMSYGAAIAAVAGRCAVRGEVKVKAPSGHASAMHAVGCESLKHQLAIGSPKAPRLFPCVMVFTKRTVRNCRLLSWKQPAIGLAKTNMVMGAGRRCTYHEH